MSGEEAERLQRQAGTAKLVVKRVRTLDGAPAMYSVHVCPKDLLAFLSDAGYRGAVHLMSYNSMSRSKYGKIGAAARYRDMGTLEDDVLARCVGAIEAGGFTAVCNH